MSINFLKFKSGLSNRREKSSSLHGCSRRIGLRPFQQGMHMKYRNRPSHAVTQVVQFFYRGYAPPAGAVQICLLLLSNKGAFFWGGGIFWSIVKALTQEIARQVVDNVNLIRQLAAAMRPFAVSTATTYYCS